MSIEDNTPGFVQLPLFDPIAIRLTKGCVAIIDPIDADLAAYKWHTVGDLSRSNAYAGREVSDKLVRMHVVIMGRIIGRALDKGEEVDHVDTDPFNNRRENLRLATRSQNMGNTKRRINNRSGYKGVSWHKTGWQSQIMVEGKKIYLGIYKTPEEAYAAYCEAARLHFGEFARLE